MYSLFNTFKDIFTNSDTMIQVVLVFYFICLTMFIGSYLTLIFLMLKNYVKKLVY